MRERLLRFLERFLWRRGSRDLLLDLRRLVVAMTGAFSFASMPAREVYGENRGFGVEMAV